MKVLEAPAAAIAAEDIEHIFAVMGDANQDIIAELCETHGSNTFTRIMRLPQPSAVPRDKAVRRAVA